MGTITEKLSYLCDTKEAIKDAIISKGINVEDTDTFRSYADKISSIKNGDDELLNGIIKRTLTTLDNDQITEIGDGVFYNASKLTSVNLPNVTKLGNYTFTGSGLKSVTDENFPKLVTINSAFRQCTRLLEIELKNIKTTPQLYGCSNLIKASFPNATGSLGSLNLCKKLKVFNAPNVTAVPTNALRGCSELETVEFNTSPSFGQYSCCEDPMLKAVIIRDTEKISTLSHTNAFGSTLISKGTGYIYVPRDLVESYQAASNWSNYASQIRALEDYTIDGTTTGDFDYSKI